MIILNQLEMYLKKLMTACLKTCLKLFLMVQDIVTLTENAQPSIMCFNGSYEGLEEEFDFETKNFVDFAGHSLGEYTALAAIKY